MFPRTCAIDKDAKKQRQKDGYFQLLVLDENRRANDLHAQEILATTENPRLKLQETTTDISKELRDIKKQDLVEQKRRQQLRGNNYDLRTLQTQLQAALVSKELDEQNQCLNKLREEQLRLKREEDARWVEECEKGKRAIAAEEEMERQKKASFRVSLRGQMQQMEAQRKKEFEAVMKDREEMQKTMKQIMEEEQSEKEKTLRFRDRCKREMEECLRNRELRIQLEKSQTMDDGEKLLAYQEQRDALHQRMVAERKKNIADKMAMSEKIGSDLDVLKKERQRREELLLALLVEERKAKDDEGFRQKLEMQEQQRRQIRLELEKYQKVHLVQKEMEFREEERLLREARLKQLAEQDKLDQLSDEKRRRKVAEHNKALREMIEMRRYQHAQDIAERLADYEKLLAEEKEGEKKMEEERIRMLKSTPKELLRYLPHGVLRPSDREYLSLPE